MPDRILRNVGGWRPSAPDIRDKQLKAHWTQFAAPPSYDPREQWFAPYDQLDVGDCVLNDIGASYQWALFKQGYKWPFQPSRLFNYFNARVLIDGGDAAIDSGTTNRSGMLAFAKYGTCPESGNPAVSWPYGNAVSERFTLTPPDACYQDALLHKDMVYESVPLNLAAIQALLAQDHPVSVGFTVYESFMSSEVARTGIMPIPSASEQSEGGHSVLAVGYLSNHPAGNQGVTEWIICRNSWGTSWGQGGYFLVPAEACFLNPNMFSDFWAITSLTLHGKTT